MEDEILQTDSFGAADGTSVADLVLPKVALANIGEPIDAIIAWIDGSDPGHIQKRARYLDSKVAAAAKSQLRFRDTDEIRYCLRSIRNFAPWVRKIWLLTDNQFPESIDKTLAEQEGIQVVDHREIFVGYEDYLPTFNSLSIETFMWRIPGLSDRFLYFNDDMLLTAPLAPQDFFREDKAVLRGKWKNVEKMERIAWGTHNQVAAAKITGFSSTHFWGPSHVAHAMFRPVLEQFFLANREAFAANAKNRFRKRSQWWSVSIHDNHLLHSGNALVMTEGSEVMHFSVGLCRNGNPQALRAELKHLADHAAKLACVNDLVALREKVPDAVDFIATATGAARAFEKIPHATLEKRLAQTCQEFAEINAKQNAIRAELAEVRKTSKNIVDTAKAQAEEAERKVQLLEKTAVALRAELKAIREHPFRYAARSISASFSSS